MKHTFLRLSLALPLVAAAFVPTSSAAVVSQNGPQVRVVDGARTPLKPYVSAEVQGPNLIVDVDGRWIESPSRRTVRVVAKAADGSVLYDQVHVAELASQPHRRSAHQQARTAVPLPRRGRVAVVEVIPVRPGE